MHIRNIPAIQRLILLRGQLFGSVMLLRKYKQTAVRSSRIPQIPDGFIRLMFSAIYTTYIIMFFAREHLGTTAKLNAATVTIRNGFTTIRASILSTICKGKWNGICTEQIIFRWQCSAGNRQAKGTAGRAAADAPSRVPHSRGASPLSPSPHVTLYWTLFFGLTSLTNVQSK